MEPLPVPICVLKVNIQCCAACPKKIKKMVEKISGVKAVDVDAERGLVTVSGTVDPSVLIQAIAKKRKRKVVLLVYHQEPKQESKKVEGEKEAKQESKEVEGAKEPKLGGEKEPNQESKAVRSGGPDGGHDRRDSQELPKTGTTDERNVVEPTASTPQQAPVGDQHRSEVKTGRADERNVVEPTATTPQQAQVGDQHRSEVHPQWSPIQTTMPPLAYPYDFYRYEAPARKNSILHLFCDENVNSCSIM